MAYLVAAVVLVGLLCMVNLLLTVGLIRRLRRQSPPQPPMAAGLAPGGSVPRFAATTTSGEPVSDELLGAPALVGFFSPGCRPCVDLLPLFAERARGTSDGVLAVIADGPGGDATVYLEQLEQVARVVVEAPQGPLQTAFQVSAFPTIITIDAGGTVGGSHHTMPVEVEAP
ncbi:thiol-disulfide isomerase/thioredoxin [Nonomuraea thailandensis]|uniref:Thiol-disulfide isomerase/thioredoxin n=1 Tax=Nonomuraea thailandensis TaxID=1188745 RepID=A0A9X2G9F0_9ACTN|nr:TlpA disulfide reductase family protein [Nonomuraea thailandensis]MCP2354756.1 thiol-disulfide isomerase/thioredoxin [Nonomuraea thailandensis]